jgi:hypothetical protein
MVSEQAALLDLVKGNERTRVGDDSGYTDRQAAWA